MSLLASPVIMNVYYNNKAFYAVMLSILRIAGYYTNEWLKI